MWRCSRSLVEFYALSVSTLTPQHLNILTSEAPSHLILASKINDHQKLQKIAPCTPIFTKFEPSIGKSTSPQMDNWRPKTMRRAPKSRLFRPSARPFFHQKRGRIALWIHWWTLQLIDFQCTKFWGCQGVKVSWCQTKCLARKFAYKLYLKYIYILKVQNDIFGDVLWHHNTSTLRHPECVLPKKLNELLQSNCHFRGIKITY